MQGLTVNKILIVFFIFLISSFSGLIALGRQNAWMEPLKKWGCEPESSKPAIPSILEAYQATSLWSFEWLISLGIPAMLGVLFLLSYRSHKGLIFWLPILMLHCLSRYSALSSSNQAWGFCGLKRNGVVNAFLMDTIVLCFSIFCVMTYFIFDKLLVSYRAKNSNVSNQCRKF